MKRLTYMFEKSAYIRCSQKLRRIKLTQIFLGTFLVFLLSCSLPINSQFERNTVTVTKLTTCNEKGKPLTVFTPEVERIYVCGQLQVTQPVDIDIHWYYENELVLQQVGRNLSGDFYNYIEPDEIDAFPEGKYSVAVFVEKIPLRDASFEVKKLDTETQPDETY